MAKEPPPIRPRVKDAKHYEELLRSTIVRPLLDALLKALAQAETEHAARYRMDEVFEEPPEPDETALFAFFDQVDAYHRTRTINSLGRALGIDVRPFLTSEPVRSEMHKRVSENVDLIKTIAPRFHESLKKDLIQALEEAPFDQAMVRRLLQKGYQSAGYNLRRLTRDQTSKAIGQLTGIRHNQLRIKRYRWSTVLDARVRSAHRVREGETYRWDEPPSDGHPGQAIQCRCVAIAIIEDHRPRA